VPTSNEIAAVVTDFNKSINLSKWENLPSDMVDTRIDNTKIENKGAKLKDTKSQELISNNVSSFA
jgi:hypothetical protein